MSVMRRLKWAASQVSTKRARDEFDQLLTVDRLPGDGWTVLDQRAWKTGLRGSAEPWARRARAAKLLTVWRSFEQSTPTRWLWIQVTPLVSEADAAAALDAAPSRLLANLAADVDVTSSEDVEPITVREQHVGWAHEQRTIGPRGPGVALYAAFDVGATMSAVAAGGAAGSWEWRHLQDIARLQAELLSPRSGPASPDG